MAMTAHPTAVVSGQEGQDGVMVGFENPSIESAAALAGFQPRVTGQEGQGVMQLGNPEHLLFKPSMLEALSGAVAARLATQNATDNPIFTFNASKNSMQGKIKGKGRKGKRGGGTRCSEEARTNIIGKKRNLFEAPADGSEQDFSFEKAHG